MRPDTRAPRIRVLVEPTGSDWQDKAACIGHDPEWWYSERADEREAAYHICGTCPVRQQCHEVGKGEDWGIWGGIYRGPNRNRRVA